LVLSILGWSDHSNAQEPKPVLQVADVLKLAIAAMGGESKWNEVQTIEFQSRSVTFIRDKISQEFDRLRYQQFPANEWIEESQQGNWVRTIFRSAEKNLLSKPGKSRKIFSNLEPEAPTLSLVHSLLSKVKRLDAEVQTSKNNGYVALIDRESKAKYLFDLESKLLDSIVSEGYYGQQITLFRKYSSFDGLLFATEIETKVATAEFVQRETFSQIRVNGSIPEQVFHMDDSLRSVRVGAPAPEFSIQGLEDDQLISNQSIKGKVTLLDFWATWCGPCVAELESLTALHKKFSEQGFAVVSVSLDEKRDTIIDFRKNRFAMAWLNGWLSDGFESDLVELLEVASLPKTILIDRDGTVLCVDGDCRGKELTARLEKIFGAPDRPSP